MTRRMSCALTADAVRARSKTVTRRAAHSWVDLKVGDRLTLVEKGQGLRAGERQVVLAEVEIVSVTVEPLGRMAWGDQVKEGFPGMTRSEFFDMWCATHHVGSLAAALTPVRRIEWRYLP